MNAGLIKNFPEKGYSLYDTQKVIAHKKFLIEKYCVAQDRISLHNKTILESDVAFLKTLDDTYKIKCFAENIYLTSKSLVG